MYKLEDFASFDKLLEAHYRARKCKRHKRDVVNFELNLAENITKLEQSLFDGSYRIKGYNKFMIYDPKEREIQALCYYDRVVQNSFCYNFLIPYYSKKLIYDNTACQKNKGTHFARKRLEKFMCDFFKKHKQNGYFLKIDIKKYFNNIDHEILKQKLGKIYDKRIESFLYQIIDGYCHHEGAGVPMGNQSSQMFALLYLNGIDRLVKEKYKIKYYCRYMDDLIIIHHDKEFLKSLFADIKAELTKIKLCVNHKSEIIAIKNGVDFLGVRYRIINSGKVVKHMKTQSKKRMLARLKRLRSDFVKKRITKDDIKQSMAGFYGNIKKMHVNGIVKAHILKFKKLCKVDKQN